MTSEIFEAKNFQNRQELEDYIKAKVGIDESSNRIAGHIIKGTKIELGKLDLSDTNSVFGIRCVAIDESIIKKIDDRAKSV